MTLYFNSNYLGDPRDEFVAWVDVMGIQNRMVHSIQSTANFVYKTHVAVLEALKVVDQQVTVYPVMDGFYASVADVDCLKKFLIAVFTEIAKELLNIKESEIYFAFVIRGGIAFGPVYHGRNLKREACFILDDNSSYRNMIMLGEPMINAYLIEKDAPPYGLAIHGSVQNSTEVKIDLVRVSGKTWWPWYKGVTEIMPDQMEGQLMHYFNWCHIEFTGQKYKQKYSKAKRDEHKSLSKRFFSM